MGTLMGGRSPPWGATSYSFNGLYLWLLCFYENIYLCKVYQKKTNGGEHTCHKKVHIQSFGGVSIETIEDTVSYTLFE